MPLRELVQERVEQLPPGRRQRIATARRELRRFAAGRPLSVLDAGCEYGALSVPLAAQEPTWVVHGVDVREEAVTRARAAAQRRGLTNASFDVTDLTQPWTGRQYDAVAALECLVEIPDDDAALRALAGATRPGGLLLLQVPTHDWSLLLGHGEARWRREARHGYTAEELYARVAAAGFRDVRVRPTFRLLARAAQEVRDRYKDRSLKVQALLLPPLAAAAALDTRGLTAGPPRAWWVTARRAG